VFANNSTAADRSRPAHRPHQLAAASVSMTDEPGRKVATEPVSGKPYASLCLPSSQKTSMSITLLDRQLFG
jgi:hypothetical protein